MYFHALYSEFLILTIVSIVDQAGICTLPCRDHNGDCANLAIVTGSKCCVKGCETH